MKDAFFGGGIWVFYRLDYGSPGGWLSFFNSHDLLTQAQSW